MKTGLSNFYAMLSEITQLSAWVLPTAGISPLLATLAGVNPPWPNKVGLTALTSITVLFALAAVFHFSARCSKRMTNRILAGAMAFMLLASALYFGASSLLVYTTPITGESFVKGFVCTREAAALFESKCPWLDLDELKSAEYEATRLWIFSSIAMAKLGLLFAWFAMFGAAAVFMGAFVAQHRSSTGKPGSRGSVRTDENSG